MSDAMPMRTGGQILIDQLVAQGVDRLACVPGESYLAALDALYGSPIDVIACRHEGGAAIMAEAYGKLTGRPGVCFVTRGPGAMNAAHGLHIAAQDSTPLILFAGQVGRGMREREAFQEIDFRAVFGSVAKWVGRSGRSGAPAGIRGARFPHRDAGPARSGCVLALPEDVLKETAVVADAPRVEAAEIWPSPAAMQRFRELLAEGERPIAILGGSRWSEKARATFIRFAERNDLPVATSFRRAPLFPADHPNYVGDVGIAPNPALAERIKSADVVLLLGGRLLGDALLLLLAASACRFPNSASSMFTRAPKSSAASISPRLRSRRRRPHFARHSISMVPMACAAPRRRVTLEALRASYIAWSETAKPVPGAFQYGEAVIWLRERLPPDAIVCNGAGNFAAWVHRYYRIRAFGTQLAPTSGSMGYGVPAAIMAKRHCPERIVVAFAGDGCFLMTGQEFATAVQYGIPVILIVIDNGMYGTIRMHQEQTYPGRVLATALRNPDFADYARAFGGHGERVERTDEFAPAFERALASGRPAIIHCLLDPEAITPSKTLSQLGRRG